MSSDLVVLLGQAFEDLDNPKASVAGAARKAIRLARLRRDYSNLYWLTRELFDVSNKEKARAACAEIAPHLTKEEFKRAQEVSVIPYMDRRSIFVVDENGTPSKEAKVMVAGVGEIEARCEGLRRTIEGLSPAGARSADRGRGSDAVQEKLRINLCFVLAQFEMVLSRISEAVFQYLSSVECEVLRGQNNSDLFDRNRRLVESFLADAAPSALEAIKAAETRILEGSAEACSHALTSCRRVLKGVADFLYPASDSPVVGSDGKERVLGNDKYVSRLIQYVNDHVSSGSSRRLLRSQIDHFCGRIEQVYEVCSKGVHTSVDQVEAYQGLLQTYILIGDLVRLYKGESSLLLPEADLESIIEGPALGSRDGFP